jgi:hypothetical protein
MAICVYAKQHMQAQVEALYNVSILYDIYAIYPSVFLSLIPLYTVNPMGPVLALSLIRHKMCSLGSNVSKRENVVPILAFQLCN